jgi:hypothetical protein
MSRRIPVLASCVFTAESSDAGGTRELLWYDVRNTASAAGSYTVDTGSGTLLPLFDADTGIMVMPSKGDGSIRCPPCARFCFEMRYSAC